MREFDPIDLGEMIITSFVTDLITEKYIGWLNDPDIVKYSEQRHFIHTFESCQRYLMSASAEQNLFLALIAKDPMLGHIGNISVSVDRHNSSADLSIMIGDKQAQGKGYATMGWTEIMRYLLNSRGIRRVTAGTMEINVSMVNLMTRSGMIIDSVRPRHFLWRQSEVSLVTAYKLSNIWSGEGCE